MSKVIIYHNPNCSKSRATLELIRASSVEPEIIEYLKTPPTAEKLDALCRALGKGPLEMIRVKEPLFKELGLGEDDERSRNAWLKLMAQHPSLIERPIVVHGHEAVLGRPPENVLDIL